MGLDFSGLFYSLIMKNFHPEKSIMVLQDSSQNSFMPFSSNGFDRTTVKRFQTGFTKLQHSDIDFSKAKIYTGKAVLKWKSFFSETEKDLIETLLYCPFIISGKVKGFFILIDDRIVNNQNTRDRFLLFIRKLTPLFFLARDSRFSKMEANWEKLSSDYLSIVKKALAKEKEPILCILLDFQEIINELKKSYFALALAVKTDCLRLTTSLFAEKARLYDLPGTKILLAASVSRLQDHELILEQMRYAFKDLFKGLKDLPDLKPVIQVIDPEDLDSLQDFIEINLYE